MDFEAINTQEEFDARVKEAYGDINDLKNQLQTLTGERDAGAKTIAELTAKVKSYELSALKQSIAAQKGIPAEMAARLTGETEKDIAKDADAMAAMLRKVKGPAPSFEPDKKDPDAKNAALINMLHELRGE